MHRPHARGTIARPTLIWMIVAGFLIISGVGIFFAVRSTPNPGPPAAPPINLVGPPTNSPNDVTGFLGSENGVTPITDKADPSRVVGEFRWKLLDPLPRGRYSLVEPELWFTLKDGRTLLLHAAKGNVKLYPDAQRPESGRFEDGVVARIFPPRPDSPARRPDPEQETPVLLFYTTSLSFDMSIGEFSTQDAISLSTPDTEIQGEGLDLAYNEVRERIDRLTLGGEGFLHVHSRRTPAPPTPPTDTAPATPPAPSTPAPATSPPTTTAPPAPPTPPREDLYASTISGPVVLTIGSSLPQTVTSDKLLLWARMINGSLPDDAITELSRPKKDTPAPSPAPVEPANPAAAPPPATPIPTPANPPGPPALTLRERVEKLRFVGPSGLTPLTPIDDEDAVLTWSGQLRAAAVADAPPELEHDHVAIRFVSDGDEPVTLTDARSGAVVLADTAHYGATSTDTALTSSDARPVRMFDSKGGRGEFPTFLLNLKSGVGQIPAGGSIAQSSEKPSKSPDAPPTIDEQRLAWSDQADFVFATGPDGAGIESIREATFAGKVRGSGDGATVTGDLLKAWFIQGAGKESLLSQVIIEGDATGVSTADQEPQSLKADKFDLTFRPDETNKRSFPSLLIATGAVRGEQTKAVKNTEETPASILVSTLSSEALEASLARDAKGHTIVTDARARGSARFNRSDGIHAEGDELVANVTNNTIDLSGPAAQVAARGTTLTGPDLHLDSAKNAVLVKGPGSLENLDPAAATRLAPDEPAALSPDQIGRTRIAWTKGMRYDNSTGQGEAVGEVVAVTAGDPYTINTVKGETLTLVTAPVEQKPEAPRADDDILKDVRLLRAEAVASKDPESGTPKATAESRKYTFDPQAPDQRRLERLTYLEGPRLIADEEHGVMSVPAPGRALVLDRSAAKEQPNATPASTPLSSSGSRGTTLFEWSGSMLMDRIQERADLVGGARVTHRPLDQASKDIITLDADTLTAHFRLSGKNRDHNAQTPAPDTDAKDQLTRATATGAVRIVTDNGDRVLTADQTDYNAVTQVIEASGLDGNSAMFLDKSRGAPLIAKRLRWNLRTDEIEILEVMPITAPIK